MRRSWQRIGCEWLTILGMLLTVRFVAALLPPWANVRFAFVAGWICCGIVSELRAEDDATEEV